MNWVVIGQGGHSKVIYDILQSYEKNRIVAFLDDKYEEMIIKDNIFIGPASAAKEIMDQFNELKFFIAIGNNKIRKKISEKLGIPDDHYGTLIHKSAIISPSAKIEKGTVIMACSVINADARIGKHAIINTKSVVEHDNQIGDFVHISPSATLTGGVTAEEGVHVGAGATVIPNMHIGKWAIIGAGSTVINNIAPYSTAVGNPAKVKGKIDNEGCINC